MHKDHAFLVQNVHFGQMTLKTTIWVSISLFGLPNPKNLSLPPAKRNLHGGTFGTGPPSLAPNPLWKRTLWPFECTKTMLSCTKLALWPDDPQDHHLGVHNLKNFNLPTAKRNLHGGTLGTGHLRWHPTTHPSVHVSMHPSIHPYIHPW